MVFLVYVEQPACLCAASDMKSHVFYEAKII